MCLFRLFTLNMIFWTTSQTYSYCGLLACLIKGRCKLLFCVTGMKFHYNQSKCF